MKKILAIGIFSILAFSFLSILTVQAANIVDVNFPCPGSDIPGFPECKPQPDGVPTNDFVGYMLQAYQFGIGIVGIIAVGMIVYGGILIAWNTESIDKRGKGREMITSALTGIAVLFGSYLILNTINPELVRFNLGRNLPTSTSAGFIASTTEALSGLQTLCGNGDPASITREPIIPGSDNCEYRTMIYEGRDFELGTNGDYYEEIVNDTITNNTKIWSYPYFINTSEGGGTSTARCLIYAYKKLKDTKDGEDEKLTMMSLDSNLSLCSLNPEIKQKNSGLSDLQDSTLRERLKNAGVQINKGPCPNVQTSTNCTSLEGMPSPVISLLENLGSMCKNNNTCNPVLTGGTEVAPHTSHGPGKSIFDMRSTGEKDKVIGTWLKNNSSVKKICTSDAQMEFRKNCASKEDEDHFHIELY
jgi:hypothetical protein